MTHLTKGANTPVPAAPLRVAVCRQAVAGAPDVDASALLLDAAGKVRGDADLVFHNQPAHPSGAVRHSGTAEGAGQLAEWLEVDLARVEPAVQRVLIAGSCDGGAFGQVPGLYVQVLTAEGAVPAHYTVTDASSETAFVLGEFYRRGGDWKFRAVGQGYASGLAGLATDFGIAVATEEPAPAPAPVPPPAPVPTPTPVAKVAGPPPVQPVASPAPPQDAVPHSFGPDFPPYTQQGHGNGVVSVTVPLPPGPVIVEVWHEGDGYFGMHTLNRRNKDDDLVYNTTLRDFRGRALVQPPQDRPLRLRVEADNAWTVHIQPLSVLRRLGTAPLQGYGPEVVAYTGTAADLDLDFAGDEDGSGYMGMWSLEASKLHRLDDRDLLVNDSDRLRQTVPVPDGPLLLILEADGAWELTARPLPVFDQTVAQASGVYQGRGEKTITLVNPAPGQPALLEYAIRSEGGFLGHRMVRVDEYGDEGEFLEGSRNGERGRDVVFSEGQAERQFRVTNAGDWNLRVLPVDQAPLLTGPAEGTGSVVFRYEGPPMLLTLRRTSSDDGSLVAHALNHPVGKKTLIANTGGRRPATGPVWVAENNSCFVIVSATDGTSWRIEPQPLDSVPVLGKRIKGHGYGVVRHTGPESEMLLTHESVGLADLLIIFELDERLFPVRRVSTASGLEWLPSGYLQIRSIGKWEIENRG